MGEGVVLAALDWSLVEILLKCGVSLVVIGFTLWKWRVAVKRERERVKELGAGVLAEEGGVESGED